jgi:hypothetical protein
MIPLDAGQGVSRRHALRDKLNAQPRPKECDMDQQLTELVDSIIATDEHPTSWAWQADTDSYHSDYIDCSACNDNAYFMVEVGGSGVDAVQLEVTVDQLREIHRKLTIQLAVITRQQQH